MLRIIIVYIYVSSSTSSLIINIINISFLATNDVYSVKAEYLFHFFLCSERTSEKVSDLETSKRKVGAEHAARDKIQTLMNWGVISEHDKRIARKCQTPSSQTSADQEELSMEENVVGGGVFSHSKAAVSAETESVVTQYLHSTGSFYGKEDHSFDSDSSNASL